MALAFPGSVAVEPDPAPDPAPARAAPAGRAPTVRAERLEALGPAGDLVRVLDGPRAGVIEVVPAGLAHRYDLVASPPPHRGRLDPAAEARADGLLRSLLGGRAGHEWAELGRFWLSTTAGWFQLGRLYDIRFRSARWPWVERSICVVSEGYEQRPLADLWAELTVSLRAGPDLAVGVANWRGEAAVRPPGDGSRRSLVRWLEQVRGEWTRLRSAGADLDAAFLAADTAVRLRRSGRSGWARPYATSATRRLADLGARFPADRAPLDDLARRLTDAVAPDPRRARRTVTPPGDGRGRPDPPGRR